MKKLFKKEKFDYVINLAAQAGVRMSIDKPDSYFDSNLIGFYNILKCCTNFKIKHLIAASSSSVYGEQKTTLKKLRNLKTNSILCCNKKSQRGYGSCIF